jgi:hypothetical protein
MAHVISRQRGSQVNTHVTTASCDLENTACFESKPTISRLRLKSVYRLFGVRFSVVLLSLSKQMPQTVALIAPSPLASASYRSFNHVRCIVGATDTLVKQTTNQPTNKQTTLYDEKQQVKFVCLIDRQIMMTYGLREYSCKLGIRRRFTLRPLYSRERFCFVETATRPLAICTTFSIATEFRTVMCCGGMSEHRTEGASLHNIHGWYSSPTIAKMSN